MPSLMSSTYLQAQHDNGIHVYCETAPMWSGAKRVGDGTWKSCPAPGVIERFHSHDYDGPNVCDCDDF